MRFSKPIEIPCLFDPKEAIELSDLGIKSNHEPYDKVIYFYSIDHVRSAQMEDMDEECTRIVSCGEGYVTRWPVDRVIALIQNRINN